MAELRTVDPEIYEAIQQETASGDGQARTDRVRELHERSSAGGRGVGHDQQVRRGLPIPPPQGRHHQLGRQRALLRGCEFVNVAERLAIARAKELFGADHANVQPHSGSQANMAVYFALLDVDDTYFGLELSHGGHLTHGHPISFSGMFYNVIHYGVDQRDGGHRLRRSARRWRSSTSRSSSSPARPRTRGRSTSRGSARSRTRSARISWSTWLTSPGSSLPDCTRAPCRTPTS